VSRKKIVSGLSVNRVFKGCVSPESPLLPAGTFQSCENPCCENPNEGRIYVKGLSLGPMHARTWLIYYLRRYLLFGLPLLPSYTIGKNFDCKKCPVHLVSFIKHDGLFVSFLHCRHFFYCNSRIMVKPSIHVT